MFSCTKNNDQKYDDILIAKIFGIDSLNSKTRMLDYYQGRFTQKIDGDTLKLSFNGFIVAILINPKDSMRFDNLDDESISFFNYQGYLSTASFKPIRIDSIITVKVDSIPGYRNSSTMNLFSIDWNKLSPDINELITFSKPIINKKHLGFIAKMSYSPNFFMISIFKFDNSKKIKIQKFGCYKFKAPAYKIEFERGKVKFLEPDFLIVEGPC
jgi:hypothetical protein